MESITLTEVTEVTSEIEKEKDLHLSFTSCSDNEGDQTCKPSSSNQTGHLNTKEKDRGITHSVGKPIDKYSNSQNTVSCHNKNRLGSNLDSNLLDNIHVKQGLIPEADKCNTRQRNKNAYPRRCISSEAEQNGQKIHHSQSFSGEVPLIRNNAPTKNKNAVLRRSKSSLDTSTEQDKSIHNSLHQQESLLCELKTNEPSQADNENNDHSCKILSHLRRKETNESYRFSLSDNQEYQAEAGLALTSETSTGCLKQYQTETGLTFPNASSTSIVNELQTDEGPVLPSVTSTSFVNELKTDEGSAHPNMQSTSIDDLANLEKNVSKCLQFNSTLPSESGCDASLKGQAAGKKRDFVLLFPAGDQEEAQCYADHLKNVIGTHDLSDLTVDLFSDIDSGQTAIQSAETLHDRYNYILILGTTNLPDDRLSRFIHEALLLNGLTEAGGKEDRVIPVWTRQECKQHIFALKHINGFEYYRFLSDSSTSSAKSYISCVKRTVKRGRENCQ